MDVIVADQLAVLRKNNCLDDLPFQVLDMVINRYVSTSIVSGFWIYFDEDNDEIKVEIEVYKEQRPMCVKKLCRHVLMYLNTFEDNAVFKKCHFRLMGENDNVKSFY
jgi:hypothetical protein